VSRSAEQVLAVDEPNATVQISAAFGITADIYLWPAPAESVFAQL
jgi:hypothetical protein